jgi:hypothetical protein
MRILLAIAGLCEAAAGLALLVYPPIVVGLLFGAGIAGVALVLSRFAGIALIALAIACWPGGPAGRAPFGMLTYSALATLYLGYIGLAGELTGKLLWPAVVIHLVLTMLLARAWLNQRRTTLVRT